MASLVVLDDLVWLGGKVTEEILAASRDPLVLQDHQETQEELLGSKEPCFRCAADRTAKRDELR